jgi:hypothetical protein
MGPQSFLPYILCTYMDHTRLQTHAFSLDHAKETGPMWQLHVGVLTLKFQPYSSLIGSPFQQVRPGGTVP